MLKGIGGEVLTSYSFIAESISSYFLSFTSEIKFDIEVGIVIRIY